MYQTSPRPSPLNTRTVVPYSIKLSLQEKNIVYLTIGEREEGGVKGSKRYQSMQAMLNDMHERIPETIQNLVTKILYFHQSIYYHTTQTRYIGS